MRARVPLYLTWLVAGVVTALTMRHATFTPWGTDPASYVHAARQWVERDLLSPDAFQLWPRPAAFGVPLGSRPGTTAGTYVSMYPLGFPVLLAVGEVVWREMGPYLIPPLFVGILVLSSVAIARRVTGDWGALLAACLVALNPIALGFAVVPMSDVPATALLMLAVAMIVRPSLLSAAAAGACIAAAVMIRPIVAPLAIVPFVLALWRWKHAAVFALAAAIGPAVLAWSQSVLYGGALTPGYPGFEAFFGTDRIATNARMYLGHLVAVHSPLFFVGLVAAVPLYFTREHRDSGSLRLMVGLIAMALLNYALYLPYTTYIGVPYTRFMLPAQTALFILLAAAVADATRIVARVWKPLAIVCVAPALIVIYEGSKLLTMTWSPYGGQSQVRLMGRYLREVLPADAVVVCFVHSAGVAYYTGRPIVRFDLTSTGHDAEVLIDRLRAERYRPVLAMDQQNEGTYYQTIFKGTPYEQPAWPARANFEMPGSSTIWYFDFTDRDRARDRIPPIDLVR